MSAQPNWTSENIPDQSGRIIVITGANAGLGYESALALARKGAHVVMAVRNLQKGQAASDQIKQAAPNAQVDLMQLNLGSLQSVRDFAAAFKQRHQPLHVLMNNAGIMAPPYRKTEDGFELQWGVNHLGHFALTGLLLDVLLATPGSRIVTVSSSAHRIGNLNFDDLNYEKGYNNWRSYGQSKFANAVFTQELQRRLSAAGAKTIALVSDPGYSRTNLQSAQEDVNRSAVMNAVLKIVTPFMSQSAAEGAWTQLYPATMPDVAGGAFYLPGGMFGAKGHPTEGKLVKRAYDPDLGQRLWAISEQMTGVTYSFDQPEPALA